MRELKQSCGAMGEEELGKMSVALLNCQSQAENRPTFTCTLDMVSLCLARLSIARGNEIQCVNISPSEAFRSLILSFERRGLVSLSPDTG